jgi:hypothetical protein
MFACFETECAFHDELQMDNVVNMIAGFVSFRHNAGQEVGHPQANARPIQSQSGNMVKRRKENFVNGAPFDSVILKQLSIF